MGLEMAMNLFSKTAKAQPSSSFVVCDPNSASPKSRLDVVDSPLEVTRHADTIFTVLPSSPHVKKVYLGDAGVLQALSSRLDGPRFFVDSTTLDVQVARRVAEQVTATGGQIVDAPVSGGVVGARAGTLSFMVGGPSASFDIAKPYLELMGQRIIHCGGSGTGLIAKLCNNHVLGINQIAIAEGMLLGTSLGLTPDLLASIINSSTGRSWPSEVNNPVPGALKDKSPPCERGYAGGFASKLMLKDMLLASDAARPVAVPLPIGARAMEVYTQMIAADEEPRRDRAAHPDAPKGGPPGKSTTSTGTMPRGEKDFSVVYDYLREQAGEPVGSR
ncbi:hypothetical protein BS47DRAFT_1337815 [Hydnum rufescens UP504]|uniref:3-hydroxyisobutyrate dehydrogenase n=1 Tax=Hydnum rufescens UP504 TaxID=1448309 RepID=A0A9P6B6Z9_9AGAM|nr:hypothetical protein BS47DRAFT_1337815 [Hydnum rufescens UP504]